MKSLLIAALLLARIAQASSPPISLSFHELVQHPAKYNGKRVSVRAYLVTSCEHCGDFFADVNCARHHRDKHSVAIGRLAKTSLMDAWPRNRIATDHMPNDGFVFVTGTFRYNDTTRPVPQSNAPHVRTIRVGGFGWMNDTDKTITDITEYRPIGRNILAGID
jgi:hypothetical protein